MSPTTVGALYVVIPALLLLGAPSLVRAYMYVCATMRDLAAWLLSTRLHALSCSASALYKAASSEMVYCYARAESFVSMAYRPIMHTRTMRHAYATAVYMLHLQLDDSIAHDSLCRREPSSWDDRFPCRVTDPPPPTRGA